MLLIHKECLNFVWYTQWMGTVCDCTCTISLSLWKIKAPFDANKYAQHPYYQARQQSHFACHNAHSTTSSHSVCCVCMWLSIDTTMPSKRVWLGIFLVWFGFFLYNFSCWWCWRCSAFDYTMGQHVIATRKRTPVVCTQTVFWFPSLL